MRLWLGLTFCIAALQLVLTNAALWQDRPEKTPSARDLLSDESLRSQGGGDIGPGFDPFEEFRRQLNARARDMEATELRRRRVDPNEKMAPASLASFAPIAAATKEQVVKLVDSSDRPVAFATVVSNDGMAVTKASEVLEIEGLSAVRGNDRGAVRMIAIDDAFDLALIHVAIEGLKPVDWAADEPPVGTLLVSPTETGEPLAIGVVSVEARPLVEKGRAFLGVEPVTVPGGVKVERVEPRSAAARGGLRIGDVITRLDGTRVITHHEFANTIRRRRPGDRIPIDLVRNGQEISVEVELDRVDAPAEFNGSPQEEMGAVISGRFSDFELVLQHDLPLWPEQCGSPILDLDGRVVGLNIARSGRVRGYAIPSGKMRESIERMMAESTVEL